MVQKFLQDPEGKKVNSLSNFKMKNFLKESAIVSKDLQDSQIIELENNSNYLFDVQ